jgi:hypothetical protein
MVSFSISGSCCKPSFIQEAFLILEEFSEVPCLTTLGTGPHTLRVYNPVVDTLDIGLIHSVSPF